MGKLMEYFSDGAYNRVSDAVFNCCGYGAILGKEKIGDGCSSWERIHLN